MSEQGVSEEAEAPSGEWQRTHPLAVIAGGLRSLQNAILPIVAVLFGTQASDRGGAFLAVPLIIAIIGLNLLGAWLAWLRLRYRVGSSDIKVEQGLISRSARSVPYERIQDVSLEQGLIPRLLGLVEVKFETGAGGKDELKLAYVSAEEGERLRESVRAMRDDAQGVAEPDSSESGEEGRRLFAMGPRRLLLFGAFEFSLIVFAVVGGAAQQFDFLLPFDIWDSDQWEEWLAGPGRWLAGLGWASRVVAAAFALTVLLILGFATGIIRTFLRDYGFRLDQTPKGFRRRRGLLTRTDVVMPAHRVQALTVSTGIARRIWGWHRLSFISLAQDAGSANHDVAPFAQMEEIAPIMRAAHFSLPNGSVDWRRPSPNYRFDHALLTASVPAVAGLAALVFAPEIWMGLIPIALAVLFAVREHFLWRYERHAVEGQQILSRRGWLAPRLQIASRVKLHSVEIAQGPIAKRRGYAHLKFGLAGGTLSFDGLPLTEAEAMRTAVLDSIAHVDFSRLPR